MLTKIHVNQHIVKSNKLYGKNDPPITVKRGGKNIKCHDVSVLGPSRVVHSPDNPLACGARIWIETTSEICVNV